MSTEITDHPAPVIPWWTRGDTNAFFGLGFNILVNVLTLTGLMIGVVQVPADDVLGTVLPALGVALILGLLTGFAAFFGGFMNASYLFAGTVSTNPVLLLLAILIVLAWRVAGYWGLDRWALPLLGVPGFPGTLFKPRAIAAPSRP